jgi:hypothetical protein
MGRQVIITESDKQRILSLYGLINEETTTSIVGNVVSNYVMSAGFANYNESKNPIEGVEVILSTIENGYLIKKQNTTKTDSDGKFKFLNLNFTTNILITIPEFNNFKKLEKKIKTIKPNVENNFGDLVLTIKEDVITKKPTSSDLSPCGDFKSTKDLYYGYGDGPLDNGSGWDPSNITISKPIIMALRSVVLQYFKANVNVNANIEEVIDAITKIKNKLVYEIVCNENINVFGGSQNFVVVKVTKDELDNFILDLMSQDNDTTPEATIQIDFESIPFKEALQRSWDFDRKIFLLVGLTSDDNTKETIKKLNSSKSNVELLNSSSYLPLYYQVDRSDSDHYMAASEPLNINTYPTVVVLKASKDPKTNYIKDCINTLIKIDGVSNDFTSIDDLKL